MKITVNGAVKAVLEVAQGEARAEVGSYLSVGSNGVKVNVSDVYGNNRTINYSITVVAISVSSPFDASIAYTGPISFAYVPNGNVQKTVHFILDGNEIGTLVDILETPASNVYVVKGETEHLIPAVPAFIKKTDPDAGMITVHLIEGM
jgi:hypothetical protein